MNNAVVVKINPINKLLTFKLKWYGRIARDAIVKYKILIMFFILMFVPNFNSIMKVLSFPAEAFFTKNMPVTSYFESMLCFQFIVIVWSNLQFGVFKNESWRYYLASLPLNKCQLIITDIILMLVANLLIWIMLFFASYNALSVDNISAIKMLELIKSVVSSILLVFALQVIIIRNALSKITQIVILNAILLASNMVNNYNIEIILFATYFLLSLFSIWSSYGYHSIRDVSFIKNIYFVKRIKLNKIFFPNFRIQVKLLMVNCSMQFFVLLVMVIIVPFLAFYFDIYRMSSKTYLVIISFFNLFSSLMCSNFFSKLNIQRQPYHDYLNTMPISKWKVFYNDYFTVVTLQFIFFAMLHAASCLSGSINLYIISINLFLSIIYLICTYYPQNYYKRYGMFISLAIMSVFFIADYNYIMYLAG